MDEESFGHVRDTVRRFVRERVIPREDEIEATDAIPDDLRAATAELGLFGYSPLLPLLRGTSDFPAGLCHYSGEVVATAKRRPLLPRSSGFPAGLGTTSAE